MPRCKVCNEPTTRKFGLTALCSVDHAVEYAQRKSGKKQQAAQRKAEREEKQNQRRDKEKVRPLKWYADRAREACHEYIRERDKNEPCNACGRWHEGQWHAGHYRPSGVNSGLRYDERNINRCCSACNLYLSGNLTAYRIRLVRKIGETSVIDLEQNNEVRRYTKEDLIEIRQHYKQKLAELNRDRV